jgi:hypothetical protein
MIEIFYFYLIILNFINLGRKSFDLTKIQPEKKLDDLIKTESYLCGNCNNQVFLICLYCKKKKNI